MSWLNTVHHLRSPKSPGTRARTNNGWLSSCYFLSRHRRCIATGAMLSSHDSHSESIFVCSYCHKISCKYESYFHIFNTMYIANICQWYVIFYVTHWPKSSKIFFHDLTKMAVHLNISNTSHLKLEAGITYPCPNRIKNSFVSYLWPLLLRNLTRD